MARKTLAPEARKLSVVPTGDKLTPAQTAAGRIDDAWPHIQMAEAITDLIRVCGAYDAVKDMHADTLEWASQAIIDELREVSSRLSRAEEVSRG